MTISAAKMALATAVALAALSSTDAAHAQRYRAAPNWQGAPGSYSTSRPYDPARDRLRDSRFTPEEQRIIDSITRNDERNGK
jgi:hypothetical protein